MITLDVLLPIEFTRVPYTLETPERLSFVAIPIAFTSEVPALPVAEIVVVMADVVRYRKVPSVEAVL